MSSGENSSYGMNTGGIGTSGVNTGGANSSGKVNSITRRLVASYAGPRAARIVISTVLLFVLCCAGWLAALEYNTLGFLKWGTHRSFYAEKTIAGKTTEIYYRIASAGEDPIDIAVGRIFTVICVFFGVLLVFRLLWLLLIALPRYSRKVREILDPLNELALKADELSRMEFGDDKYHVLEDAIANLDADESSKLSLGDSDLLGIEAAINNLLTRIREANRQQARFVNDASHELRTPIAVISGYADMLARWGKDDEKVLNESITAIQTETERMKHLVEQLLFLARGDSGKTQLQKEDVKLEDLMREAYEESVMIDEDHVYRFRPEGFASGGDYAAEDEETGEIVENSSTCEEGSNAGVTEDCTNSAIGGNQSADGTYHSDSPADGLTVSVDPGLLKQAVRILIDNAAKYTQKGDEIILSCGQADGHPYLQVQDSGIGMAASDAQHMFERFYRADKARSFEGTGLGLSIAKWIVDKHHGHFEVLSRQDIGTRIRIVL